MSADLIARAQQAVAGPRKREGVEQWMFGIRDEVAELLADSPYEVDSYLQAAFRVVQGDSKLQQATREAGASVLGAIMLGARLQLQIGGPLGHFYLTPRSFKNGDAWGTACVPMIGYRGFFELGYRSGNVSFYDYKIVREGDHFDEFSDAARGNWYEWRRGADDYDEQDWDDRPLTNVVALCRLTNGDVQFQAMSRNRIDKRKPKNTSNTPWEGKHYEAMYVKTVHRELAKYQQLTVQQATAAAADETIQHLNRSTKSVETVREDERYVGDDQPAIAPPADGPRREPITGEDGLIPPGGAARP